MPPSVTDMLGVTLSNTAKRDLLVRAMRELPPDQFMRQFARAAIVPIARQMIEDGVMRQIFQVDTIDTPVAMYQTKRRQTAMIVAKYGARPERIIQYPRMTIVPFYIQTAPEIELSDLVDAMFDVAGDIMFDAGREMAVKEDKTFLDLFALAMVPVATTTTTTPPTLSDGPGGIGFKLSSNIYQVGSTATAPAGGLTGQPAASDVIASLALLRSLGYRPDTVLMNPISMGILASQQVFLLALNAGNREVQETGMLQRLFGNRIFESPLCPAKSIFMLDAREFGRFIEREPITVRPEQTGLRMRWLVYERVAPFVRNSNAALRLQYYV